MLQYGFLFAHIGFDLAELHRRAQAVSPRGAKSTEWVWVFRWRVAATRSRLFGPGPVLFFSLDLRSLKRLMRASVPGSRAVGSGFTADLTMAPGINGIKIYENVLKIYCFIINTEM